MLQDLHTATENLNRQPKIFHLDFSFALLCYPLYIAANESERE